MYGVMGSCNNCYSKKQYFLLYQKISFVPHSAQGFFRRDVGSLLIGGEVGRSWNCGDAAYGDGGWCGAGGDRGDGGKDGVVHCDERGDVSGRSGEDKVESRRGRGGEGVGMTVVVGDDVESGIRGGEGGAVVFL